jgi:hypothetical protein
VPDLAQTRIDPQKGVVYTLVNNAWVPRKATPEEIQKYKPKVAAPAVTKEAEKKPEPSGPSLWQAANKPIGKDVNKPLQGINQKMDTWLALHAPEGTPDAVLKAVVQGANLPLDIIGAVEEAGRRTLTPIGVATLGLASKLQSLRESTTASKGLKTAVGAAETGTGAAFGAEGVKEAATEHKDENWLDAIERRLSGLGQGVMGLAPVGHALGPSVKEGAKTGSRELLGIGDKSVARERSAVETANAEKLKQNTEAQSQARAKARGEYEAGEAERKAEAGKAKKKFAEETAAAAKEKVVQSKADTARRSYEDLRDRHAESTSENLDKAEKTEKLSLDARYEDFRKKVLGVSKEFPNGTLEADLSPVGEAVVNARKNILKGSAESIKQFNDILGKLKDFVETPEGDLTPVPGQKITADQLHGYVTELNEKLYDSGVSGDIRDALKHVRDAAENSVTDSIGKAHGKTAVKAYSELKGDYNDYMDTWRDVSSGSPLPNIRKLLRQPMATKRGIPVYREVADILEGSKGEKALAVIARKRAFGADPALAAKLRKAGEKLSSLPKPKEVKPVERPEMPKEPTSTKYEVPAPKETKPFNAEQFRREKIGDKAQSLSNLSMWDIAGLSTGAEEVLRGVLGGNTAGLERGAALFSIPIVKRLLARGLSKESIIEWLAKEKESGGTPPTPPVKKTGSYKPSEKAETMSGPRKSLGPEWEAGERTHEIDRYKAILRNARATTEERLIARLRLSEMGVE